MRPCSRARSRSWEAELAVLKLPPDEDDPGVEIDRIPFESDCLPWPKPCERAEGESDVDGGVRAILATAWWV
jgi:hypothetical protein